MLTVDETDGIDVAGVEVEVGGHVVQLSSPDKELVTGGVTKHDLVEHWLLVGEHTLQHCRGAPVSARRAPDGPDGELFFQKNAPTGMPTWVRTAGYERSEGGQTEHVVLEDVAHLVALVQFGTVEVHVGLSPADDRDQPREVLLDLDPPGGSDHAVVRRATRRVLSLCDELGLPARLKTSGSKGFHVHVPVTGLQQQDVRRVAGALARVLAQRHGEELTTEFRKDDRAGRVLVDWFRNSPGATAVAPWSPRALPDAPCAVPLDRDELAGADPRAWTVDAVRRRLAQKDDPWAHDGVEPTDLRAQWPALRSALEEVGQTAPDPPG